MENGTKVGSVAVKSAALSLLIVDDEVITRNLCNDVALEAGLHVYASSTTEQALDILDQYPIDIVVTDLKIPQLGGLELIKRIRAGNPQVSVIVLTQYGTIETAIEATRLDCRFDGAILREHDDRNLRIARANPLDEFQPSELRDFQIRDDDVDRILVQDIECLLRG